MTLLKETRLNYCKERLIPLLVVSISCRFGIYPMATIQYGLSVVELLNLTMQIAAPYIVKSVYNVKRVVEM
jgi:hypothetical protein